MARVIYIVNVAQVVTSENHPEGLYSNKSGYPKLFDSRSYDGNLDKAFRMAESEYRDCESVMLADENPVRVMTTITLERADGIMIYHRSMGTFPAEPEPEPEPEEPQE
jgi:hypothetical protein